MPFPSFYPGVQILAYEDMGIKCMAIRRHKHTQMRSRQNPRFFPFGSGFSWLAKQATIIHMKVEEF